MSLKVKKKKKKKFINQNYLLIYFNSINNVIHNPYYREGTVINEWNEWVKLAQMYPTLCKSKDCSPPGSSIHGILQTRILEWVAISFSRGIFSTSGWNLGLLHWRQILYCLSYQGSPTAISIRDQIRHGKERKVSHTVVSDFLWSHGL